ncbi:MAG: HIT family protein [Nitratireductor sp.]|jgi:diadenosine tetraphosphate (Ap4A) HIT family hydrolase
MMRGQERGFILDRRLNSESEPVIWLGLCELRVMNDRRWPWLVLVPHRTGVEELFELTPLDQTMITFEVNLVGQALKEQTGCTKINVAALGNMVRQLHVHIVARAEGDPNWPGPVWGHGLREPYRREDLHQFVESVRQGLSRPDTP